MNIRKIYDQSSHTPLKVGTRIELHHQNGNVEKGRVVRWLKSMGKREWLPAGYEPIKMDGCGTLMMHVDGLKVL